MFLVVKSGIGQVTICLESDMLSWSETRELLLRNFFLS